MKSRSFSWCTSLLSKASILSVGIVCLIFIGWPVPETRGPVERKSSLETSTLTSAITKVDPPRESDPESYFRGAQVDVNHGQLEDLEKLPGIGPVLAQRIIEHRQTHGRFQTVDDLHTVPGIGKARIARLRLLVTVNQEEATEKPEGSLLAASQSVRE